MYKIIKKIKIGLLEEQAQERWDEYVQTCSSASLYHHSAWKDVLTSSFGHTTYYLYAEKGEKLLGILPIAHLKSRLFGSQLISLPGLNYGGICAQQPEVQAALIHRGVEIARELGAQHLELRQTEPYPWHLALKQHRVAMILDLPDSWSQLWSGFSAKLRNQIRKGERQGFEFRQEQEEGAFYQVFSRNMRDLGTPVYGKKFFRIILNTFPERARICTVYHGSKPVASGLIISFKDTLHIPWASSLREYNSSCANMLLYARVLRYACEMKYASFDFGRCAPGSGTYRFKKQWGARPRPLYWHYWLKDKEKMPALQPENPKYRLAIQIWKKTPLFLSRVIGPLLIRNMP